MSEATTYACDDCYDTGTRKIVDYEGNKLWVDCPYCDAAEKRAERHRPIEITDEMVERAAVALTEYPNAAGRWLQMQDFFRDLQRSSARAALTAALQDRR